MIFLYVSRGFRVLLHGLYIRGMFFGCFPQVVHMLIICFGYVFFSSMCFVCSSNAFLVFNVFFPIRFVSIHMCLQMRLICVSFLHVFHVFFVRCSYVFLMLSDHFLIFVRRSSYHFPSVCLMLSYVLQLTPMESSDID